MTKPQFIQELAMKCGLSMQQSEDSINTIEKIITDELVHGRRFVWTGFLKFDTVLRHARMGVDPNTLQRISIPAVWKTKFQAGLNLKEAIRSKRG